MKRQKNLERVIVLSLLMSSSIYGTVFANNSDYYGSTGDNGYSVSVGEYEKDYKNFFIAGSKNGIKINGSVTVEFTATDSIYIGKYTDGDSTEHISSEDGIYVANGGKLNITATNNNSIYGGESGIYGTGKGVNIEIKGNNNDIYAGSNGAVGIWSGAKAIITAEGENNIKAEGPALSTTENAEIEVKGSSYSC